MSVSITSPARLDAALRAEIGGLAERIEQRDGAPPLSDQALTRLGADDLTHLVAVDGDGRLRGYAQLDGASAEAAADEAVIDDLLAALEQRAATFEVWAHGRSSPVAVIAAARGYARERLLWQLSRPLSALTPVPWPADIGLRTFRVGSDEPAWLTVNAAAFAHHPEQGRWTMADLVAREAEPWFDPAGFLLAERDGELLGFHWTKQHPGRVGEVYVLAVAPAAQGLRLGAALLAAGLEHLAAAGCTEVMLYVDDDNPGAVHLYEQNGFTRANLDAQYRFHRDGR